MLTSIAIILIALTALFHLAIKDWRICLAAQAIQFTGVFLLVVQEWPIAFAISQLLTGWIAIALLGMVILGTEVTNRSQFSLFEKNQPLNRIFYLLEAVFVILFATSAAPLLSRWIPGIENQSAWAGLILIGSGCLRLGFSSRPLLVTCSLFTLVSGFEALIAPLDSSTFTVGTFAIMILGLALIGSYFQAAPFWEDQE